MDKYKRQIESLSDPTFQKIRDVAVEVINALDTSDKNNLWERLKRGVALLDSHKLMCQYLFSYGNMHEAKILDAASRMPHFVFENNFDFDIVDWGCGQGLATITFFDLLKKQKGSVNEKVGKVTLIDPSSDVLDRASLHVSAYVDDTTKIRTINKYLDDVTVNDVRQQSGRTVINFFSNILDIKEIDLKKLAGTLDRSINGQNFIVAVGPTNSTNHRIDAFFSYFDVTPFFSIEGYISNKWSSKKWTYIARVYNLDANSDGHLADIKYYPPVQFHAGYQLDCIKEVFSKLKDGEKSNVDKFFQNISAFNTVAPFDIGGNIYDDIHPVLAVLNNIITRGLPTKASPFIESVFASSFGYSHKSDDSREISFPLEKDIDSHLLLDLLGELESLDIDDCAVSDLDLLQLILSPIAIARTQKLVLEALIVDNINIDSSCLNVLIEEKDVPCAAIAIKDLEEMFNNLTVFSEDYRLLTFPEIRLDIISSDKFHDSPLHMGMQPLTTHTAEIRDTDYDIVIRMSTLRSTSIDELGLGEFKCKSNSYFIASSSAGIHHTRNIYTTDKIEYRSLVTSSAQGDYSDIYETSDKLKYFLRLLFRKKEFRPGQLPILDRALQNKNVIGLLPTGGGKSLTYQLAALLQPGVTIIVDPLKSLMQDQYDGLLDNGIDVCAYINSSLTGAEKAKRETDMVLSKLLFVYLSPERLGIYRFRQQLKSMHEMSVYFSYGVIDEVHCVSEWGHDFRTHYLHLGRNLYSYVKAKNNRYVSLFGLTATASFDVLTDVERELSGNGYFDLDAETIVRYENTNRLELQYRIEKVPRFKRMEFLGEYIYRVPGYIRELQTDESIEKITDSYNERQGIDVQEVNQLAGNDLRVMMLDNFLDKQENYDAAGIIFCPHAKSTDISVEGNYSSLRQVIPDVGAFTGGSGNNINSTLNLKLFRDNKISIMVATKAFGMGIDKPNVRFTINMNHSSSLESFVQEAGRAGRDGKMALSIILFSDHVADRDTILYFHNKNFQGAYQEKIVMHEILSRRDVEVFYGDDAEYKVSQVHNGFLPSLINSNVEDEVVSLIRYGDDMDQAGVAKAIYRMSCIGLIDDFTQHYGKKHYRVVAKRKREGEYFDGLKSFLLRYYTEDRVESEINNAKAAPLKRELPTRVETEIYKCLNYLTSFIYDKIAVKRMRAIDDMRDFCIQGLDESKDWKDRNEDLKDFLYYYFNSKYAKDDYVTENGDPYSLINDTDRGKVSSKAILFKYLEVINDVVVGSGTPMDNIKHLHGAVRLIRRSLTDTNPSLSLLNAFCLLFLGTNDNDNLITELTDSYYEGMIGFHERLNEYTEFWMLFDSYNDFVSTFSDSDQLEKLRDGLMVQLHVSNFIDIADRYLGK